MNTNIKSAQDLRDDISAHDGLILSDGTLNLEHLLPKAYDFIKGFNLSEDIAADIESVFTGEEPTSYNRFYGFAKLDPMREEEACYLWNDDIYNLFNDIAPAGFYFGSQDGDGALIGWFSYGE